MKHICLICQCTDYLRKIMKFKFCHYSSHPSLRTPTYLSNGQSHLSLRKANIFVLQFTRLIRTLVRHFPGSWVTNSHVSSTPPYGHCLSGHCLWLNSLTVKISVSLPKSLSSRKEIRSELESSRNRVQPRIKFKKMQIYSNNTFFCLDCNILKTCEMNYDETYL